MVEVARMTRGVRLYLVGSFVLVSLAGCGRGLFQAQEREPWRAEAEIACLKSGAVKENADLVRIDPISGPGVCGAEFPLKVAALGESSSSFGFADDDLRPPGNIGNQPRWPISQPPPPPRPIPHIRARQPGYAAPSSGPISLTAPGVAPQEDEIDLPAEGEPVAAAARRASVSGCPGLSAARPLFRAVFAAPLCGASRSAGQARQGSVPVPRRAVRSTRSVRSRSNPPRRWPVRSSRCSITGCPNSVQPAAMRWFGARVVEIKQISAYSCRGMNGNPNAHISEHAFGNALDIAAFTLADGRRISVRRAGRACRKSRAFCTTCRLRPAANSPPCWRRAPTSITTITSTWI